MTKRALVIHHLRDAPLDAATQALGEAGFELDHRYPIDGDPLPDVEDGHDVALVHGSLADVTKLHEPGISEEYAWLDGWWASGRPYFGVCHGLQLAAQFLGARVGPPEHGQAEFGYYPLISHDPALTPDGLHVFQWHYYGADLPAGCERIASSELYPNQVVRFGPARFGLQCHAELGLEAQRFLCRQDPGGVTRPGAQSVDEQSTLAERHFGPMRAWFLSLLRVWLDEGLKSANFD